MLMDLLDRVFPKSSCFFSEEGKFIFEKEAVSALLSVVEREELQADEG